MKQKMTTFILVLMGIMIACFGMAYAVPQVPEGYPEVIEGLDFGGAEVFIYDWWSGEGREAEPTEAQQRRYDYEDWLQETYNVKITRKALSDYDGMLEAIEKKVDTQDDSELCIVAVENGRAGEAMKEYLFMPWTYGLDQGVYDAATVEFMTKGDVCYGVPETSYVEPRQGVFFNKKVLEEAGIDWNELYDAQRDGTWDWAKMEDYMDRVQRDVDGDGETDIWALTGNADDVTIGLVASNGADFYQFDESGKLVPAIESEAMQEALEERTDWRDKYEKPSESWDSYMQYWADGNVAFMIGQSWEGFISTDGTVNQVGDWGFVALPKGPSADGYTAVAENNVFGVPDIYDSATALKLEQLFTLYAAGPGTDDDSWADAFYALTDDRAIEETYAMLRDGDNATAMKYNLIGNRNTAITEVTWEIGGGTPEEITEGALAAFQERCDAFNAAAAKKPVRKTRMRPAITKTTSIKDQVYTGKAIKPEITVKVDKKTLVAGKDYKITYKNNKSIGTATVIITGKGKYIGTIKKTFTINPDKVALTSVTAGSKKLTAKWEKGVSITGYELQYGQSSSFKSAKNVTVNKAKTTTKTISNLKKGKTYYVRVRTYKNVDGTTYYSKWSKSKKTKVK